MKLQSYIISFLLSLAVFSAAIPGRAQMEKCFPEKALKLVYDEANVFSAEQRETLEKKLEDFEKQTSNQIVVVTVNDLCGYDKAEYVIELGDTWQVGQKDLDNGIILLVKPKTRESRGETFIAVGRGLEGAIPDGNAWLIVENELIPRFKENDYYAGIDQAVNVIISLSKEEYSFADYQKAAKKGTLVDFIIPLFFILAFFGLIIFIKFRQAKRYASVNHIDFWLAWQLLNQSQGRRRGYQGGGFGGFGGSGSSGGGFGGFGGGSFGGGGAGGSW